MTGNHHEEYKRWCLALWIARDLPSAVRRKNKDVKWFDKIPSNQLRRSWMDSYEERNGKDIALRSLVTKLYNQLKNGETPKYNGPFQFGGCIQKQIVVKSDLQQNLF